ncbi:MAG: type II secretion system secretin GspD [Verrucomicrobia bacterium]|jgi:general secretion pathway protein D|nr:type II secretion system secretin GspD [Verrucomicrobiota bacterium]
MEEVLKPMRSRYYTRLLVAMLLVAVGFSAAVSAQGPGGAVDDGLQLKFSTTPLEIVLQDYSEKTGKTLLRAPDLPAPVFTLRSQGKLTLEEYLFAVETELSMHGIGLVPTGEKFIRVVPIAKARREDLEIKESLVEGLLSESSGELVSQMIMLKHIDIAEATKAIDALRHEYGQINAFERTNSILVTDTGGNINRMLQVLRFIDQPIEAREEPQVLQVFHAKASDIKSKLEEIIAESQKEQKSTVPKANPSGAPGVVRSTPGVIRARTATPKKATGPSKVSSTEIADAERGIIRGVVKIVADERTNKLIIITRPENMTFLKMIVDVLDVETSPDVMVKVVRLEFAEAKDIASMLNDLIGATDKEEASAAPKKGDGGDDSEAKALREYVESLKTAQPSADRKSSVGELSKDNIKILSDERTNSLIIMASKGDLATLIEIIDDMDMMLSQVLIEAVIIDVKLGDALETGVSWIQNSLTTYGKNAAGSPSPVISYAGGGGGGIGTPVNAVGIASSALPTSGLGYFLTLHDLNINALIKATSTDTRTKVVSTPVLLTTDNTEATLSSKEKVYVFDGRSYYNSSSSVNNSSSANYKQEEIGLELKVTPHINDNKVVMMEIMQEISEPGDQSGNTDELAGQTISINRKIEASIAVKSGQTIVLGGQVRDGNTRSRVKIPLLGSIPLLGRLFNSDSRTKSRTETIVFITPYVLDTPEEVAEETLRRRDSLNIEGMWKHGWSGSELAEGADRAPRRRQRSYESAGESADTLAEREARAYQRQPEQEPASLPRTQTVAPTRQPEPPKEAAPAREAAAPVAPEYVDDMALDDSIFNTLISEAEEDLSEDR